MASRECISAIIPSSIASSVSTQLRDNGSSVGVERGAATCAESGANAPLLDGTANNFCILFALVVRRQITALFFHTVPLTKLTWCLSAAEAAVHTSTRARVERQWFAHLDNFGRGDLQPPACLFVFQRRPVVYNKA
jgi:hypothetical protein